MFKIEYNIYNECWYVKDGFGRILKGFDTEEGAEYWLQKHKKDIKEALNNFRNCK